MARWADSLGEMLVEGIHAGGLEVKVTASGRLEVALSLRHFVIKIDLVFIYLLASINWRICLLLKDLTVEH